jgi:serine/threonine protein kinase
MIGTSLNHYEVTAKIGAGGMGEVYRARDTRLGRDVAIKVLPTAFASDGARMKRFEQEARTLAALNHPNILVIHDVGVHGGAPHLVSELLEGQTLHEVGHIQFRLYSFRNALRPARVPERRRHSDHERDPDG